MAKPQPVRVLMDTCAVPDGTTMTETQTDAQGGEVAVEVPGVCFPHEGEWADILPGVRIGEMHKLRLIQELGPAMAAAEGEADEMAQTVQLSDDAMQQMVGLLSKRVVAWNITDDLGEPLPQPHKNPAAFDDLRAEELMFLMTAVKGETAVEKKAAMNGSLTTFSATPPPPSPTLPDTAPSPSRA